MAEPRVEVDLAAFRHNVKTLSELVAPARTMLAVKADAYGHGLLPLARAALEAGADSLAVLEVPAGLELRMRGITAPLFAWLHGTGTDFRAAVDSDIDLGVSALWQLEAIIAAPTTHMPQVHLKVDTGLHRNGARPQDWPALVTAAVSAEHAGKLEIAGIWSHLADASPEDDAEALARFNKAIGVAVKLGATPPLYHLAASSAGIRMPEARLGLVRFGIAAYGITPFDDKTAKELGLKPVMTVRAPVTAVAEGVATIALGSADGIPVPAAGRAEVLLKKKRHTVLAIDIDSLTIDTGKAQIAVGDDVVLFGADAGAPTAEDWATWAETIGDEIVARASTRIPRTYLN